MGHKKLSNREEIILRDIIQRSRDLPLPLADYVRELGRIREESGVRSRIRREKPKGFVQSHDIHARPRYGQAV